MKYFHKHVYVYQFEMNNHATWPGKTTCSMQYALCTNKTDANHKENRLLLEHMLRVIYGYMPKHVKFIYERIK
jgi:hypothetical protein